jgi:hypothetical protein
MEIRIICTGEQKIYHEYFKPFLCTSDIDLPKMYNIGYNTYEFIGVKPDFIGENMPEILKQETDKFLYYESEIQIFRNDLSSCSGYYLKTVNKYTNETEEKFLFN